MQRAITRTSGLALALLCGCGGGGGGGLTTDTGQTGLNPVTGATSTTGMTTVPTTGSGTDPGAETETDSIGTTGMPEPECEGIDLQQGGALDLDIPEVEYIVVSGAILLNGEPPPDAPGPRGQLAFEYTTAHGASGVITHTLAAAGAEAYSVVLPAGQATVRWLPDPGLCAADPDGPMPCTGGVLLADVNLSETGVLDLDVPAVTVSGDVRQSGATMPDEAGDRGHLVIVGPAGDAVATLAFGPTGAASYAVTVFPGPHDIQFVGNPALCGADAAKVPCNTGVLLAGVALESSGVFDLDVPAVQLTGAVTVGGAAVADGAADRGALRFRPADAAAGGEAITAGFGASGPVDYALSVVAGTYDVELVANPALCTDAAPVPCAGGRVLASVGLMSSGVLDVDIPMIAVGGAITRNGATLPDEAGERGALVWSREDGGSATVPLGDAGPASYALPLLPGLYSIAYAANVSLCDGVTAPQMPCTGGALQSLELDANGTLDIDLGVVSVAGAVTRNGAPLPSQVGDRGAITIAGVDGSLVAVPLGTAGAVAYAVTVLPGTYDVVYSPPAGPCIGLPDSTMPCGGGRLAAGVALVSDGVLDLDVPAIEISGAVTHRSAPLPDLADSRGAIRWTRVDGSSGDLTLDLGADGPGAYALALLPGRWLIEHAANPDLCVDAPPDIPCTDQVLLGCPDL